MILIADSGSTKTTWWLTGQESSPRLIHTEGMNPYFQSEENINKTFHGLMPQLDVDSRNIKAVYFYGAGCTSEKAGIVRHIIGRHFPAATIDVNTDLLAAARSVCGREAGIACIIGTGSNSCFYDGNTIAENIPSLGYILGDEGSGAYLGRQLVSDLLKGMIPNELKEKFLDQYGLTTAIVIEKVYRQPFPNRFLAGLSPFLADNLHEPVIKQLVYDAFKSFFIRNLMNYDYKNHQAGFVGSIAFRYKEILEEVATDHGVTISKIVQSPMDGLIAYHINLS